MDHRTTALERAFEPARSGRFASVEAIKKQMKAEGFSVQQITGSSLSRQLVALIRAARSEG
jgi:hypothetical protein